MGSDQNLERRAEWGEENNEHSADVLEKKSERNIDERNTTTHRRRQNQVWWSSNWNSVPNDWTTNNVHENYKRKERSFCSDLKYHHWLVTLPLVFDRDLFQQPSQLLFAVAETNSDALKLRKGERERTWLEQPRQWGYIANIRMFHFEFIEISALEKGVFARLGMFA